MTVCCVNFSVLLILIKPVPGNEFLHLPGLSETLYKSAPSAKTLLGQDRNRMEMLPKIQKTVGGTI